MAWRGVACLSDPEREVMVLSTTTKKPREQKNNRTYKTVSSPSAETKNESEVISALHTQQAQKECIDTHTHTPVLSARI